MLEPPHPHHAPSTFGDFLRQYAMIVLSILTALGLEQVVVSVHDAATARASRGRIEAELAAFDVDLKASVQTNSRRLQTVNRVLTVLEGKLATGEPDQASVLALGREADDSVAVNTPTFQRNAWDAAIADRSVTMLRPEEVRRYALIYGQQESTGQLAALLLAGDYVRLVSGFRLGLATGKLSAADLAQVLALDAFAVRNIVVAEQNLADQIASPPEQ